MIAGSFDVLTGQVIRIGHMGENANEADVVETLEALKSVLNKLIGCFIIVIINLSECAAECLFVCA